MLYFKDSLDLQWDERNKNDHVWCNKLITQGAFRHISVNGNLNFKTKKSGKLLLWNQGLRTLLMPRYNY